MMKHIFISCVTEDIKFCLKLYSLLSSDGWKVIHPLSESKLEPKPPIKLSNYLEEGSVDCVLVIWSKSSVKFGCLYEEAFLAMQRDILIQIILDNVDVPPPFNIYNPIYFTGHSDHDINKNLSSYEHLKEAIERMGRQERHMAMAMGLMREDSYSPPPPAKEVGSNLKRLAGLPFILAGAAIAGGMGFIKKVMSTSNEIPNNTHNNSKTTSKSFLVQSVEFAAFGAKQIVPDSFTILDVWAYLNKQEDEVLKKAASVGHTAKLGLKSGIEVRQGAVLSIALILPEMIVDEPVETMVWSGQATNTSFVIGIPSGITPGQYPGKVKIDCAGINIAKIIFMLPIVEGEREATKVPLGHVVYPRSAFASYASQNRADVLERIQGMKMVAPNIDIFLDVLSLRAGQNWLSELEKNIEERDAFYLFWSLPASQSQWVEKEWRLALEKRGLDYISPVPLDEPSVAPPPIELSSLHFNDAYLAYIKYHETKQAMSKLN
jgi:hypothetical protein